jgi:putative two-component system response regulator
MIVDDAITNLKFAKNTLKDIANIVTVPSAEKMFTLLETVKPSLILLDINMPTMNGFDAIAKLKNMESTSQIPVIFLTAKNDPQSEITGLALGAVDYITKPFEPELLIKRVEIHLTLLYQRLILESQSKELSNFNNNLQKMVQEKTDKVIRLQKAILNTVADIVESRDTNTGEHISRTRRWLGDLLHRLRDNNIYTDLIKDWDFELILQSSQLHDVGKIAISDNILKKKGPLTKEEFESIKTHVELGVKIIDKIGLELPNDDTHFLQFAKIMAYYHHEKWDGTGYPSGLSGENIPLLGRLMAITDVYDALTSDRPYKKAFTHDIAINIIIKGAGYHFDPIIVNEFIQIKP